ncbi:MAG: SpoIIE family protein phosphatase, partial [Verrucomicrobiota bacterium]
LVPLLCLRRFQQAGHVPIALAGGATGMIDEAMRSDGTLFTVERVLDLIRAHPGMPAAELARHICQAARDFTRPEPQTDDFTVVLVRVL